VGWGLPKGASEPTIIFLRKYISNVVDYERKGIIQQHVLLGRELGKGLCVCQGPFKTKLYSFFSLTLPKL